MTRSWVFTLAIANKWYNLWNDLITQDSSFGTKTVNTPQGTISIPDNNFDYHQYTPSNVRLLKYQSSNPIVTPANAGAIINRSADINQENAIELLSGSWDVVNPGSTGIISLKNQWFRSNLPGAVINVEIATA